VRKQLFGRTSQPNNFGELLGQQHDETRREQGTFQEQQRRTFRRKNARETSVLGAFVALAQTKMRFDVIEMLDAFLNQVFFFFFETLFLCLMEIQVSCRTPSDILLDFFTAPSRQIPHTHCTHHV
jgi:hypothetical protein